jgi:predicted alpha-1,2-mannosidase
MNRQISFFLFATALCIAGLCASAQGQTVAQGHASAQASSAQGPASPRQASTQGPPARLTSFVDPYIGSGGHGHVFVGASVPFGAVQLGPDNFYKGWDWCSGYHYGDSVLIGFAHTHLNGTGIGDLGDVLIMPYTGAVKTDKGKETVPGSGYASHYSHKNEKVRPGYYSVKLDDYNIRVELTATERVGYHRYHFPEGKPAHVIIDLKEGINDRATDTYIEQVDDHTFEGRRYSKGWADNQWLYFAIRTSEPIHHFSVYNGDTLLEGKKGQGKAIKGLISFDQAPATLQLKVGISPVSPENALANIDAEIPGWNFDEIARQADEKWNRELSRIRIETPRAEDKKIFYTAMYHTMIDPMLFNDHNGDYRGADKKVYPHAAFQNYTVFSLWDTYRALNPLYTIIQPERVNDIVQSLLAIYQQQGKLPVWHLEGCETNTMPGVSSVQVVAEAYMKGYKGFDPGLAFAAMTNTMMTKGDGLNYDQANEFIPSDKVRESVAKGLEYSISNASIALVAKQMGKEKDYDYYSKRFHNYQLYYDPVTGFFRGKRADGTWNPVFNPVKSSRPWINDLSEGNHWQYLWLVPEDVEGLIRLMGGEQRFSTRLDSLFTITAPPDPNAPPDIAGLIGQYAHGDEPGHQTIYLYAYAGQQWKTAEKARFIMKNMYPDNVDGLSGNEDCGQMSAWYILSALGFYPVFPANGGYVLGSPLFDKESITLPNGKTFTVEAVNNGPQNKYIQRVEWNGVSYNKSYILHKDILSGGPLKVYMGKTPNHQFGSKPEDRPRSVYP